MIEDGLYEAWRAQFPRLRKALVKQRYQLLASQGKGKERGWEGERVGAWERGSKAQEDAYGIDWDAEHEQLLADLKPALQAALNSAMFMMVQEYLEVAVGISWETYNAAAAEYAKKYTYDLVSQINASTRQQVGEAISAWIEQGREFPDLVERVWKLVPGNPYPNIRDRAQLIAATETTRVFADTQAATLKAAGLKGLRWRTAEDELVCPTCSPMGSAEGGEGALGSTDTRLFISPGTGGQVGIPAHPGCRCWAEADTDELEARAAQLPKQKPKPTQPEPGPEAEEAGPIFPDGAIPWEALSFEQKMDFYVKGFGMKPGGKLPKQVMEGQLSKPTYMTPQANGKMLLHYDYDGKKPPMEVEIWFELPAEVGLDDLAELIPAPKPAPVLQPATHASTLDYLKVNHGIEEPEEWLQANPDKVPDLPTHFVIDEDGETVFEWDEKAPLTAEQIGLPAPQAAVTAPKPAKKPAKPKPGAPKPKAPQDDGYLASELISAYEPAGDWDGKLHKLTKPEKQAWLDELAPGWGAFDTDAMPTHYSKDPATGKVTYWFKPADGKTSEDYKLPAPAPEPEGFTVSELLHQAAEQTPPTPAPEPEPKPAKAPPKAAFPHKVSELAADKSMSLKGMHAKAVYTAPDGSKWLFKPQEEFRAYGDQVAYDLAAALGHDAAETYVVEVGGRVGSIQRMFPIDGDLSGKALTSLGADDVHRIQREGIFDWLIGNHDGHEANLVYSEGRLIGIDKGQLFKFYDADRLHWDYNPNHGFGVRGVHNKLLEAYVQGKDVPLANYLEDKELSGFLDAIEGMDDDAFKALLRPYAERAARYSLPNGRKALAYQDVDKFLAAATERKNGIRGAFGKLWDQAETARAKALGVERRPAVHTRLTGPNVVLPVDENWTQEMRRAKWQGKSFLFGGEDVENMAGLVYQVEGDGTVIDFKIRPAAENTMLAKLGDMNGGANLVVPNDPYWADVLKVAKSYNYHFSAGSPGYDGKMPAATAQSIKQLHGQLQAATDDISAHYKQYIADLHDEITGETWGGQVGKVVKPWEYKAAPVERKRGVFDVKATPAQTLAVQNERGAIRLKGNDTVKFNGKGFTVEFDGEMRANYTLHGDGNGSIYSKQGRMQIRIDGEFTTEKLDKALGYLEEMGVTARLATADDLELLYLQKVSEAAGVKASEIGVRSNLTAPTRLKKYKEYWAQRMGVSDLADLPSYKPMPIYDSASRSTGSGGGGYGIPRWQRFDLNDADLDRELGGYGLMHSLYGSNSLDGLRAILENNGALVSTEEKWRIGVPISGMSPDADQRSGGASYVFTRLADEGRAGRDGNLIFSKRLLLDPDVIMYDHDAYGKVSDDYATKNRKRTLADMRRGSSNYSNEVIVPRNISLIDHLEYVNVRNTHERTQVLALFRQHGIEQIRGRSIETIVRVNG